MKYKFKQSENRKLGHDVNYIYGRIPVLSYLDNGHVYEVFLAQNFSDQKILQTLKARKLNPKIVSNHELDRMSSFNNHQGIVARIDEYITYSLLDLINSLKEKNNPIIVMLDEVMDPHNLGAIIRNIDAFNIDGLIIKNKNQAPLSPTVYKVSTGALSFIKVAVVANLNNAIQQLKEHGYWIYAISEKGSQPYYDIDFNNPSVVIFGNEGKGISKLILNNSDYYVSIPMFGHVESLNVASSSAILLSYIRNKH